MTVTPTPATVTIQGYTVTFDSNGAGADAVTQAVYKGVETKLNENTFTRTGYTFAGWNTAANGSGTTYADKATIDPTADLKLYAQWTANTYTVKFDANGGSGTMADQSFTYDVEQALTANAFTKENYTFAGWALTADGDVAHTDRKSVKNLTATNGATVTLYAIWTQNPQVTVTFNANGGSGTMEAQTIYSGVATALTKNAFTRNGYSFAGWATSASGAKVYDDEASVTLTANTTLYAVWTENTYTVSGTITSFEGNHEPGDITIELISDDALVTIPKKTVTGTEADYEFTNVPQGTYTLKVTKLDHATWTEKITVNADVTKHDVKIHLLGDINGDGKVTTIDFAYVYWHVQELEGKELTGYQLACADVTGDGDIPDGEVTNVDAQRINQHARKVNPLW